MSENTAATIVISVFFICIAAVKIVEKIGLVMIGKAELKRQEKELEKKK